MAQFRTFSGDSDDAAILAQLGERLAHARLDRNLTQAELAHEAGVSRSTVRRLEAGASTQLTHLIRVLRALDLVERLDLALPAPEPRPLEELGAQPRRQRASGQRGRRDDPENPDGWTWDEDR